MRELLNNLFARDKSPLSSPKAAAAWCARLHEVDPQAQRERVAAVVREFLHTQRPVAPDQLQSLLLLDEEAQGALETIRDQYVANPRMAKNIEQKLFEDIVGFAEAMVQAYGRFVLLETSTPEKRVWRPFLPQAIARSLHYLAVVAKWHYFRFDKVPGKLWSQAHSLYRLSEIEGFDSNPFALYGQREGRVSSCADEYIQLLMLNTVAANNLSVRQLDWVDDWLDVWSHDVQISRRFLPDRHHYCVNLTDKQGPEKVRDDAHGEPYRYWGIFEMLNGVQDWLRKLEAGATPQSLGMNSDCRTASCIELLKHLEVYWSMSIRNAQIQRSHRHNVQKTADVVHGLDRLYKHVRADNGKYAATSGKEAKEAIDYDEVMDMRLYGFVSARTRSKQAQSAQQAVQVAADWQSWNIENESEGGYGAILPIASNEWARPGELLGMRFAAEENWRVCVIRRLSRLNEFDVYAGVQVLSATPVAVQMRTDAPPAHQHATLALGDFDAIDGSALLTTGTALYVPHEIDGTSVNTLLVHSADYAGGRIYQVQARDRKFTVSLGAQLEKGVDWIWVTVTVLSQSS
ncbi:hypothetical protein JCM19000A_28640 [Silvimonas sp. JCM 19000]